MGHARYNMNSLFAQLGLESDTPSIDHFIDLHSPLAGGVQLHEALFWSKSQADFLQEASLNDAEWVVIIDALNCEMHLPSHPRPPAR